MASGSSASSCSNSAHSGGGTLRSAIARLVAGRLVRVRSGIVCVAIGISEASYAGSKRVSGGFTAHQSSPMARSPPDHTTSVQPSTNERCTPPPASS
jgi:hypothetical protein